MHDTYYTILHLTPWVRAGLITLSGVLAALTFYAAHQAHRRIARTASRTRPVLSVVAACMIFWLFIWLSPQIYYLFYWMVIPDLPFHSVIATPPSPGETARLLAIDVSADLPPIAQGLLGWALLAQAIWHGLTAGSDRTG